ncbi:xanthine dehydrogenase family protein molybdopterin-binding subunit [Desulfobacula sp.]|uniref:xanthine dehydrogenase family protein molybdopterin-binding subunit n=1 Tax=Desulfobacula sp. TaxID=2593537 RepID=UPI0025C1A69A|nr:xanthine dehydrogenase family protein molybdopterin-binding subunit [Desulfobacula sp.]MBC2703456.1 xanthine dehydrogenase family protein molybdopterin-binding subunit [Desulfobacula sp.]
MSKNNSEFSVVGKRIPKLDAAQKAMGRAEYIQDVKLPGMLFGKILYSKHAHANIVKIDTSKAKALAGVHAVLTGEDVPKKMKMGFIKDNPPIKKGNVCSLRDEVAAVAAISPEIAKKALDLIEIEYEELEGIFDPEKAMEKDSPLVHEHLKSNVLKMPWNIHYGDVEKAEKESAFVVEDRFTTTWVTHCCMGTSGAVALFDASENLTIYTNTQIPSLAHKDFLEALKAMGLENKRVRVIKPVIGGGFGSKLDTYAYEHIAILLAYKCRKPVKIVFDRVEEFKATSTRQPTVTYIKQGCDKNGKLTFRDMRMVLDNGGHTSWGATTPSVMLMPISSLYRVENVKYNAKCVYTNNTYSQAMRGYGNPQATFAIESSMDMLAEKAGIDRIEFRKINKNQSGDETPQGLKITSCGLEECIDAVKEELKFDGKNEKGIGTGIASLIHVGGGARIYGSDGCGAILKMDDYGKVDIFTGGTDMGQGLDNITAQIVAEELGLLAEDINVVHSDTDICPWDVGAHASRSTFVAGNAALGAAKKVKKKIQVFASKLFDVPAQEIELKDKLVFVPGDREKSMLIGKLLRKAHFRPGGTMLMAEHFYDPDNENMGKELKGNMSMTYSFGAHGAKVKVDEETGKVEVLEYVAAHDVGRAINPLLLEGQVYGGVIMGLGYALTEEVTVKDGEIMNANFRDYKLFTAKDAVKIKAPVIETDDKDGPFGAKGIGEPGCVPTAPAIANAIYDAVGVRIKDLPITPEKVLAALKDKNG